MPQNTDTDDARPDVLVMIGSDHFHQLWLDNMPQFLVGKAPWFDANFYNEEREFGLRGRPRGGQLAQERQKVVVFALSLGRARINPP